MDDESFNRRNGNFASKISERFCGGQLPGNQRSKSSLTESEEEDEMNKAFMKAKKKKKIMEDFLENSLMLAGNLQKQGEEDKPEEEDFKYVVFSKQSEGEKNPDNLRIVYDKPAREPADKPEEVTFWAQTDKNHWKYTDQSWDELKNKSLNYYSYYQSPDTNSDDPSDLSDRTRYSQVSHETDHPPLNSSSLMRDAEEHSQEEARSKSSLTAPSSEGELVDKLAEDYEEEPVSPDLPFSLNFLGGNREENHCKLLTDFGVRGMLPLSQKPMTVSQEKEAAEHLQEEESDESVAESFSDPETEVSHSTNVDQIYNVNCRMSGQDSGKAGVSECESELEPEEEEEFSHRKINPNNFSYMSCNVRGYASKRLVFNNIIKSSEFDVVFVTETHQYDGKGPEVPGYIFTNRCREKAMSKGGVSIGIRKELEPFAIKVFEGTGTNECLMIQLTCFEPNIVVCVMYGNQEATAPKGVIQDNLVETFSKIHEFQQKGFDVIVSGDLNLHIGDAVRGNDPAVSKGGKFLIDLLKQLGLEILNNKAEGDPFTHYDVSSGNKRVLDLIISNAGDKHEKVEIDNEKLITPYRIRVSQGVETRLYTDHLSLQGEMDVRRVAGPKKMKVWRISKPGGREEYLRLTDEASEELTKIILETEDTDVMLARINELIQQVKMKAFGIRTLTHKRMERETDQRLSTKRVKELSEAKDRMDGIGENSKRMRLNEQVFLTRKRINSDREEILSTINHYKTGEKLETADQIYESILQYNAETLKKNECRTETAQAQRDCKAEAVRYFETVETEESEAELTMRDYEKVIDKVQTVNKTCYRDFLWAGPKWQAALFLMFKRIYQSEIIPKEFLKTKLKKLYKRKGDKTNLSSYRFIHLKEWAGKIMEKLVMEKCNKQVKAAMPAMQIGGAEKSTTLEHIISLYTIARIKSNEGRGVIVQLIDCKKCFDKQLLSDTMFAAARAGLRGKQLRMTKKLHDNTEISLAGDTDEARTATVTNSTGQGTNWAPCACALAMGQAIKAQSDLRSEAKLRIGEVLVDPLMFVDDVANPVEDGEKARKGGEMLTDALDELGLEAHPDKSRQVLMGTTKWKKEVRKELEKKPVEIQDFILKESEEETYLGNVISAKGPRDSVSRSIKKRIQAAVVKEIQLSKILEDDMMERIGWIEAVRTLFNSIIVSTVSYGSQAYVFMTKKQESEIEACIKDILYRMLRISKYTQYAAVLLELNMIRMKHIINQLKISFINNLVHEKGSGFCLEILREEEKLYPGTGLIAEVQKLCEYYNIEDVTQYHVDKDLVKEKVWKMGRQEVWKETLHNRRIPFNDNHMKITKAYMRMPKYDAKLFFAYRTGELQFKEYRKGEFKKKFGNTWCFGCGEEPDTLEHVMKCCYYERRFQEKDFNIDGTEEQLQFIEYLKKLDRERTVRFGLPILYRRSLRDGKPP